MTREEFMATTTIKSSAEAKQWLKWIKHSQLTVFIILLPLLAISFYMVPWPALAAVWIVLGVGFSFYNDYLYTKLAKLLNYKLIVERPYYFYATGPNTGFSPHYPLIIKSLKVLAGEKVFSELQINEIASETNQGIKPITFDKGFWRILIWAVLAAIGLFAVVGVALKFGWL